jgi:hypothetical protein
MSTKKPLYMWTGSEWILVGDGGGLSAQAASELYLLQEDASQTYLTQQNASATYFTNASAASLEGYIDEHVEGIYNVLFEGGANYLSASGGEVYGDVLIEGNLTVSGSTTYLNTTELNIEDNLITLNYGISGSPSISAGIEVERGESPNVSIQWNESNDRWEFTKDGSTYKELGSGAVLYQSASPDAVALGLEVGSVWIDSDGVIEEALGVNHIHGQYLSVTTASSTYLTQNNASNLYLTQTDASSTYATILNLNSGIVTASVAAYSSASAYTDSAIASFEALPNQSGNNGKYLTTNGASTSWQAVDALPSQSGNSGKYLTTNGASASWTTLDLSTKSDKLVTFDPETTSYTLIIGNADQIVEMNVGSANNLTVPLNSSVPFPVGTQITILQTGTGQTTIVATVGVTINSTPGLKLRTQWSSATLIKRAENTWVAIGDLSA